LNEFIVFLFEKDYSFCVLSSFFPTANNIYQSQKEDGKKK